MALRLGPKFRKGYLEPAQLGTPHPVAAVKMRRQRKGIPGNAREGEGRRGEDNARQEAAARGEGGIRTLAPVSRPIPLAGAPLRPT